MAKKFTAGALMLVLILTLTLACSGDESPAAPETDRTQQELLERIGLLEQETEALREQVVDQPELGLPIYLFQGQETLGGDIVEIKSLTRQKPMVVNFWGAEAPPSRAELPEFQSFHEKYGDQVLVLGVDLGQVTHQGSWKQGLNMLTELGITFSAG